MLQNISFTIFYSIIISPFKINLFKIIAKTQNIGLLKMTVKNDCSGDVDGDELPRNVET